MDVTGNERGGRLGPLLFQRCRAAAIFEFNISFCIVFFIRKRINHSRTALNRPLRMPYAFQKKAKIMCAKRSSHILFWVISCEFPLGLLDCNIHPRMWHICIKLVFRQNNWYTFYAFIPWCILLISWLLRFWRKYVHHKVMCYWICNNHDINKMHHGMKA